MEWLYVGIGITIVLFMKPLVWVPLLFMLDRLAGLLGPEFRNVVSGHYAGKPLRYFMVAQVAGSTAAQKDLERRSHARGPAVQ